jgi:hypothetical protein
MQRLGEGYLCPRCSFIDTGRFCSSCGSALAVAREDFATILARWLTLAGYEEAAASVDALRPPGDRAVAAGTATSSLQVIRTILASLPPGCGRFFVLDQTNVKALDIASVLELDTVSSSSELARCITSIADAIEEVGPTLKTIKETRVKKVTLTHYLVSARAERVARVADLRRHHRSTIVGAIRIKRRFVAVDLARQTFEPRSILTMDPEIRKILDASLKQLTAGEEARKADRHESLWGSISEEVLAKPTASLRELAWVFWSVTTKPMHYAGRIQQDRIAVGTALSYLGLLIVFTTLVEKAVGLEELTAIQVFPVVDEIIAFLLLLVLSAIGAALIHVALKAVGGKGTFRQTFIAQIVIAVVLMPSGTLIDASIFFVAPDYYASQTVSPSTRLGNAVNGIYLIPMLSVIHGLRKRRVGLAFLLMAVVTFVCVVVFLNVFNALTN